MNNDDRWVETYSGKRVSLTRPDPETIDIFDIARSLSRICRFNGHSSEFYSVAQHCCLVHDIIGTGDTIDRRAWALLHDAEEAYIGDIVSPVKQAMADLWGGEPGASGRMSPAKHLSHLFADAIKKHFKMDPTDLDEFAVHDADNLALAIETKHLMPSKGVTWNLDRINVLPFLRSNPTWLSEKFRDLPIWGIQKSHDEFLERFDDIEKLLKYRPSGVALSFLAAE